ncbi:MAG: RdgB/HAM1 family non-canonical purine NTP pyrophosphatase [Clostridiaceae bacterium]|nr:RdgB/HAM1 family non-canonical purine NTP pyrophosphatase [Clostridiaceae bacterium]MDD6275028.1 RdgB/HAM1 family non-canonical purine NTP pyrophosphatase [Clostridiaceae bacterium]
MKWVIASSNPGKLREFRAIFDAYGFELITKAEAGVLDDPEENGTTFEENALIKARACAAACGLPSIADDSGLTVDALGGAPGIYSARYAQPGHRKERVLRELEAVPDKQRGGAFYCAIACVIPGECEFTVSGECRGYLTREVIGTGGFGYDPIFYVPEYGTTFGEIPQEIKNRISHRALALAALRKKLEEMGYVHADK